MVGIEERRIRFLTPQHAFKHVGEQQRIHHGDIEVADLQSCPGPVNSNEALKRKLEISLIISKPKICLTEAPVCVLELLTQARSNVPRCSTISGERENWCNLPGGPICPPSLFENGIDQRTFTIRCRSPQNSPDGHR